MWALGTGPSWLKYIGYHFGAFNHICSKKNVSPVSSRVVGGGRACLKTVAANNVLLDGEECGVPTEVWTLNHPFIEI
jgi:hypothetical protein